MTRTGRSRTDDLLQGNAHPAGLEKPVWAPEKPDKTWCSQPTNIYSDGGL